LFIVFLSVGTGVIFASYLYNTDSLALIYYTDSVSHLVRARQLIDYSSPGLEQIGAVWLPLPHFILLPSSLIDLLFKTGFAGTFVSLPSIVITSIYLYKLLGEQTNISWIALLGSCLYFLNPNILYLGITAMTEALFMLFFIGSAYYFQKSLSSNRFSSTRQGHHIVDLNYITCVCDPNQNSGSNKQFIISSNMFKCSFFVALATLCRYEAWPIPVFLTIITILTLARVRPMDKSSKPMVSNKKRLMGGLLCMALSFSGIILWVTYNWIYFDNPLEFLISPYYSAASQALKGQNRDFLFLHPLNASSTYSLTSLAFFGPAIIAGAIFGYIIHRKSALKQEVSIRDKVYLYLAIPPIFTLLTLVIGIGEMNYLWFNSRFLIMLSPLLILLQSNLVRNVTKGSLKKRNILGYFIAAMLLICPIIILPITGGIVTLIDAKNSAFYGTRPYAMDVAKVLNGAYDGGNILVITGSAQQNIIMQASGIQLTNFYSSIKESNTLDRMQMLEHDIQYIILSKKPDLDSRIFAAGRAKAQDELMANFDKSYENSFYLLYVRK
jgi:hypothetical protein